MRLIKSIFKLIGFLIKLIFQAGAFLLLVGICLFIYARYIEPQLLIVHNEKIVSERIKKEAAPLKFVQFSDTHLSENYTLDDLRRVINKINANKPDIIVFTGDLVDDNTKYDYQREIIKELSGLKASKGKLAVYGNHDHGGNGTRRYKETMEASDFIVLKNTSHIIDCGGGQKINVIGLDDLLLGSADIKKAMKGIKEDQFNLFIAHEPDVADKVKGFPIDMQLSGHSHGGQVTVPILGPPFTPPYAKKYIKGMYSMGKNNRMMLYVNSGLGTTQMRYRFFNIPEITVFTLEAKSR